MSRFNPFGPRPAERVPRSSHPPIRFVTPISRQHLNRAIKRQNMRFILGLAHTHAEDILQAEQPLSPCSVDLDKHHPTLSPEAIKDALERLISCMGMRSAFYGEDEASGSRAGHTPESVRERELERSRLYEQRLQEYPSTENTSDESEDGDTPLSKSSKSTSLPSSFSERLVKISYDSTSKM